jgi:hypothetical protein
MLAQLQAMAACLTAILVVKRTFNGIVSALQSA